MIGGNSGGRRASHSVADSLRIVICEHDPLPLAGEPARDIGRKRRLAAAALRIGDEDRAHGLPRD